MENNISVILNSRPGANENVSNENFEVREVPPPSIYTGQMLVKTLALSMDPYLVHAMINTFFISGVMRGMEQNSPVTRENFGLKECCMPKIEDEQVLVKTLGLSLDPALRCRFNQDTGADYLSAYKLECPIEGIGVGVVVESKSRNFTKGDIVESFHWPWQNYAVFDVEGINMLTVNKVNTLLTGKHYSLSLGILGLSGLTSIIGVQEMGHIKEGANQTLVVSGAAGACGSLAGQIGRVEGCTNVVGICGTQEKCKYLTEELGFNHAINYKEESVKDRLRECCPDGVDVYFDNVGGDISNTVVKQMTQNSNIILCGQISMYNTDQEYPPSLPPDIEQIRQEKNIKRDRFLVLNYMEKFPAALKQLKEWHDNKKVKYRETVTEGVKSAPEAFVSMMSGGNIGKQIVHVADH